MLFVLPQSKRGWLEKINFACSLSFDFAADLHGGSAHLCLRQVQAGRTIEKQARCNKYIQPVGYITSGA